MRPGTLEDRLRLVVIDQLNVSGDLIKLYSNFCNDLGADSLDMLELLMAVEDEFKAELKGLISEEDAMKLVTFGAVYNYIKARLESTY